MIYKFRNKLGDEKILTEKEIKDLMDYNYGDIPDSIVIPTALGDKDYFRVK